MLQLDHFRRWAWCHSYQHWISTVIAHCTKLRTLSFTFCDFITEFPVPKDSGTSIITSLDMTFCKALGDSFVQHMSVYCPLLTSLNLDYCLQVTNQSLLSLGNNCPLLTALSGTCTCINGSGLTYLVEICKLAKLDIGICMRLNDSSLRSLSDNASNLTELHVDSISAVTNEIIHAIAKYKALTYLDISHCTLLTDSCIFDLVEHCQGSLKYLYALSMDNFLTMNMSVSTIEKYVWDNCFRLKECKISTASF